MEDNDNEYSRLVTQKAESTTCCVRIFRRIRHSNNTAVAVMFIAFMLDLMLLTVVEPLLPDIIHSLMIDDQSSITNKTSTSFLQTQNVANITKAPPIVSVSQEDQSVSAISVGLLNGAKPLTQVILNPFIGVIVDRTGHTFPMLLGFVVAFLSTLGFAFAQSYTLLLITRCCQGLGSSLLTIAGLAMLSSVYQDQEARGRAMGIAFSGLAFGLIVGFPMGSFLYQFAGREVPFLCLAGLILLGGLIRFGLMPIFIKGDEDQNTQAASCSETCSVFLDCYILIAAGVYFWLGYAIGAVTGIGPLFLQDVLGAEQWQIGVIFLAGAISQNITQYSMAMWSYRIGWWLTTMIGLFITAVGMGTYTIPNALWLLLIPQSIYAGGLGFVMGSIPPLLSHLADIRVNSQYGIVFSLSDTGTNLGYFLGSTVTGLLVERFNYLASFAVMAVVIALYSFMCYAFRTIPTKSRYVSDDERRARLHRSWRKANRHSLSFSTGD